MRRLSRLAIIWAGSARRISHPAVLIPTGDAGALFLAEQGDSRRPWFLFAGPPRDLRRRLAGKHSLYHFLPRAGRCPPARHDPLRYLPTVTTGRGMPAMDGSRQASSAAGSPAPSTGSGSDEGLFISMTGSR